MDYNRITHAADYYQPILDPGVVWGWYRIDLNMFSCDNKTIIFSPSLLAATIVQDWGLASNKSRL